MREESPESEGKKRPSLASSIIKVGEVAGAIAAIGGLVGDFLRPLAAINLILFLATSVASILLLILCVKRRGAFTRLLGMSCFFFVILAIGFGAWWAAAESKGSNLKGLLAEKFGVVGRVQDVILETRKVDGENLAKDATESFKLAETTSSNLAEALKGYPANVLSVKTSGDMAAIESQQGNVTVGYQLKLGIDGDKYDTFAAKVTSLLEGGNNRKGEVFVVAKPETREGLTRFAAERFTTNFLGSTAKLPTESKYESLTGPIFRLNNQSEEGFGVDWWKQKVAAGQEMVVVVNTARNSQLDRTTWRWYVAPSIASKTNKIRVDVRFLDGRDKEVTRDSLNFGPVLPGFTSENRRYSDESWKALELILSPFIVYEASYIKEFTIPLQIPMTRDELKSIKTVRCTVVSETK